jgi:hypothetical protein
LQNLLGQLAGLPAVETQDVSAVDHAHLQAQREDELAALEAIFGDAHFTQDHSLQPEKLVIALHLQVLCFYLWFFV